MKWMTAAACAVFLFGNAADAAAPAKKEAVPLKSETLTCKLGDEDRHARIAMQLRGGKTQEIAYYSKWKPRTCSVYLKRNDAFSKWTETGNVTTVQLEQGRFVIYHQPGEVRIVFNDINRERYCGMEGTINGSLTVWRGRAECQLEGIMEEGDPLGSVGKVTTCVNPGNGEAPSC